MKKLRALTASILASAMAMSMTAGFAAFAAEGDATTEQTAPTNITKNATKDPVTYTVSVINTAKDKEEHKYEAYQIFTATESIDGTETKLTVTGWGAGVKSADLLDALKTDAAFVVDGTNLFADATTAQDVADIISEFEDKGEQIQAFGEVVGKYLGTAVAISTAKTGYTDIEVGTAGYYLIKDVNNSLNNKQSAMTRYILTPTNTINPTSKADFPTIEKNIIEDNKEKKANSASIGDIIVYQLDSKVPDMTGYNKYFYIVNDSMYKGLTLDTTSFEIKVGNKTLVEDTDFYYKDVDDASDDYDDFEIVFVDFIEKYKKDEKITITYKATLNENAKVGIEGNPNIVDLTFSNDPNYNYEGTPGTPGNPPGEPGEPSKPNEPGSNEPTGKTPPSEVITYTTGIELIKIDKTTGDRLTGAEFSIEGNGINWIVKKSKTFTEDANGTYYKLKDGTYTDEAPDGNEDSYADTETKYILTETADVLNKDTDEILVKNLAVDSEGVLKIDGLNAGTYKITETTAPTGGYIKKTDPITVTIGIVKDNDGNIVVTGTNCEWTYSGGENGKETEDGTYTFNFSNVKGVVLPGTGGFGSKLMYALGTIFTGAGAAYMISKKKSKKEEE